MACSSLNNYRFKDGSFVGYIQEKGARSCRQRRLMLKDEFNNFSIYKVKLPGGAVVG